MSDGPATGSGIAVVGLACRLPGARSADELWRNLRAGVESISFFSTQELAAAGVDENLLRDPAYVRAAPVLADVDRFDADFFECSPRESRLMDPQHRLFLETAWEALEDAGYAVPPAGTAVGVFAGSGGAISSYLLAYADTFRRELGVTGGFDHLGNDKDFLATRASFKLDLRGPSLTVQTACSTSLVAVHVACQSLLNGECDMALAGGVTVRVPQISGYRHQEGGIFSPDGHCRAFDAAAQGTVFGSGIGIVALKPLADAQRDGDFIHAVIRGSAINNDGGAKVSFTAASLEGQARAIAEALAVAGCSPDSLGYVEAHGTGTVLGDPLEIAALTQVFRQSTERRRFCGIGSVKSNLGHLEAAAGVTGLIKAVLALRHGEIPPSLHCRQPNPRIDFAGGPFYVPSELTPWPEQTGPRRAAVNSLGIGGTNAFLVLEQAPRVAAATVTPAEERPLHLLALSAKSDEALRQLAARYRERLETAAPPLADVAYTAGVGRRHFAHRLAVTAADAAEMGSKLAAWASGAEVPGLAVGRQPEDPAPIAFLFTGQGAQYSGMGRQLHATQPVFRAALERCDELLRGRLPEPLLPVILAEPGTGSPIDQTAWAQPALFALGYALVELWRSWGIEPAAVMGHSVGEYTAAWAAGVLSLEDALGLVAERGRLMQGLPGDGAMAAVTADEATVAALLARSTAPVTIAALNGPRNTVISGERAALASVRETLAAAGIKSRDLAVSHAFHSPLMELAMAPLERAGARVTVNEPRLLLISNLTGEAADGNLLAAPDYWARHLRLPVRFAAGLQALWSAGCRRFVEIGPAATLLGMAARVLPEGASLFASLRPAREEWPQMLETLAALYAGGAAVDWAGFDRPYPRRRLPLPTYPFTRRRFWIDDEATRRPVPQASGVWPGRRITSPAFPGDVFEAVWNGQSPEFLADHCLHGEVVVPGASHLALALSAAREALGEGPCRLADVTFPQAFHMPADGAWDVQLTLAPDETGEPSWRVYSRRRGIAPGAPETLWTLHANGRLAAGGREPLAGGEGPAGIQARAVQTLSGEEFYRDFWAAGYHLGPSFRWIRQVWRRDGEVLCRMEPPSTAETQPYQLHPGLVDACFQISCAAFPGGGVAAILATGDLYVPLGVARLEAHHPPRGPLWCHAVLRPDEGSGRDSRDMYAFDLRLWEDGGETVAEIRDLRMKRAPRELLLRDSAPGYYGIAWEAAAVHPEAAPATPAAGAWLILADRGGLGAAVAARLAAAGDSVLLARPGEDLGSRLATIGTLRAAVHFGALDLGALDDAADPVAAQEPALGSVVPLLRALTAHGGTAPAAFWLVTRGALPADGGLSSPAQATFAGLAKVIAFEHPEVWGGLVDLDPLPSADEPRRLVAAIVEANGEDAIALRGERRWVPRLERRRAPRSRAPLALRPDATYLVTGGRGGLGLVVARLFAARGARTLVLAGRGEPGAAANATMAELAAGGVRVVAPRLDVGRRDELTAWFAEMAATLPPLAGVVHAAGVIADGILLQQDWDRFAQVLSPKLAGAWHLHLLTRELPLDFFALFSSSASLLGAPGQGSYAAANAFLDALAHHRRALGLPAVAINWGPWSEVGMAAAVSGRGQHRWTSGALGAITPAMGAAACEEALAQEAPQLGVLPFDWPRFLAQFQGRAIPPLFGRLTRGSVPRAAGRTAAGGLREEIAGLPPAARSAAVHAHVERQVAAVLGLDAAQPVTAAKGFTELGLDSLMAIELKNRLQRSLGGGRSLPSTLTFDYPSLDALAGYLSREVLGLETAAAAPQPAAEDGRQAMARQFSALSDAEAEALLLAELDQMPGVSAR